MRPSPASRREAPSPGGRGLGICWYWLESHGLRRGLKSAGPPGLAADRNEGGLRYPLNRIHREKRDVCATRPFPAGEGLGFVGTGWNPTACAVG